MTTDGSEAKNLIVIFSTTLMAIMGVSLIAPSLPLMARELGIPPQNIGLIITIFTLPGIFIALVVGILIDTWGRKEVLVPALIIFGICGGAIGLVNNFRVILILRFLQGLGAAGLAAIAITLIGDLYHGSEIGRIMGYNAGVLSIGTGSFPFIGGALALASWNYPFFLFLISIVVALFTLLFLESPKVRREEPKLKHYFVSALEYVRNIRAVSAFIAATLTFILLYGAFLTYFALLLDMRFHVSSFTIGILMSIMSFTTAAVSTQAGRLQTRFSKPKIITTAFFIYGISLLIFPFIPTTWLFPVPVIIFGIAMGMNIPALQTLVAELAPIQYRGVVVSLLSSMNRLGQTLGPVVLGGVYLYGGMNVVFWAAGGLAIVAASLAVALRKM